MIPRGHVQQHVLGDLAALQQSRFPAANNRGARDGRSANSLLMLIHGVLDKLYQCVQFIQVLFFGKLETLDRVLDLAVA